VPYNCQSEVSGFVRAAQRSLSVEEIADTFVTQLSIGIAGDNGTAHGPGDSADTPPPSATVAHTRSLGTGTNPCNHAGQVFPSHVVSLSLVSSGKNSWYRGPGSATTPVTSQRIDTEPSTRGIVRSTLESSFGAMFSPVRQRPVAYPSRRSRARPLCPEGTCGDAAQTYRRVSVRFPREPRLPRHGGIHHLFPVRNATGKPQLEPFPSGARRCHVLERTPGDGRVRVGTASQTLHTPRGDPRLP
jgi:hypothetical protein